MNKISNPKILIIFFNERKENGLSLFFSNLSSFKSSLIQTTSFLEVISVNDKNVRFRVIICKKNKFFIGRIAWIKAIVCYRF